MAAHTSVGARVDVIGVIQQLERALADELDYRIEARNAASFRKMLAEFPRLLVPKVIEAYTTERVLTMERVHGLKVDAVPPIARLEHDFTPVADELTRAYLKGITIDGFFHADPHPGNVFVVLPRHDGTRARRRRWRATIAASTARDGATPLARIEADAVAAAAPEPHDVDARLALVDFGMTARLSSTHARDGDATPHGARRSARRRRRRHAHRDGRADRPTSIASATRARSRRSSRATSSSPPPRCRPAACCST